MKLNEPKFAPATLNLAEINQQAADEIEKAHKKPLGKLRANYAAWLERQTVISRTEIDRREAELIERWERGEVPAEAIITTPCAHALAHRLHHAGRRIETYSEFLDKQAAPITADLLDLVADKIEHHILPGASDLDAKAAKFGEAGNVGNRVLASISKLRAEAERFRAGNATLALAKLEDYLPLS